MSNSDIWMPAGSIEEAHQRALMWVCDAYLFYLVSLHRRPVYRHQYGDISLNQPALQGFTSKIRGGIPNGSGRITSTFWTSLNICIAAIQDLSTGEQCRPLPLVGSAG